MKAILEVDDLWDPQQIQDLLIPLKERYPNVVVNAFTVPNKFGPINEYHKIYPWIKFCIHGFEHTHYECLEWTTDKAKRLISKALEMGYEPVFKAPNYFTDDDVAEAVHQLGVILVYNQSYQPKVDMKMYPFPGEERHVRMTAHLVKYQGTRDYIKDLEWYNPAEPQDFEFKSIKEFVEDANAA